MRLFCIPHAGGSASVYHEWIASAPDWLQVCPVELPGRGSRWTEPLPISLVEVARSISCDLYPYVAKHYAILGHSMGALLAYETALNLKELGRHNLRRLFLSGCSAPSATIKRPALSQLSDRQFLEYLASMQGTPEEILANPELMELLLPLLRADFQMFEEYPVDRMRALHCSVTILGGYGDEDVSLGDLLRWSQIVTGDFECLQFPGGHFFIEDSKREVMGAVFRELERDRSKT